MANGGRIDFTVGYKVDKTGLNDIKSSIQELQKLTPTDLLGMNNYTGKMSEQMKQARSDLAKLQITASEVEKAFNSAFNPTTGLTNLQKLNTALKNIGMNNISQAFAKAGEAGNQAFYKITKGALTTNMQLRQTGTLLDKIGTTFGNTLKWGISSSVMNKFVGSIQQAYGYVQHLDTSLNDIRIVTGKSADEMNRFAETANNAAKALGASTTEYTEAALIYYQQGLADEEAQARAETTLKAANVTGQSGREVSEELTAVWNGYRVTAEETEKYVDKLAAVAATTASNLEELSTGMSKVASAANNMGVDVDQLNAQLATIISVTRQAPETAGTALKTIYARLEDLKISGEDEDGIKLGDVSSTLDELGIHVIDAEGNLRDLGGVIEEVAAKWDTWSDAQQSAAAQAMAGKRQYNNLLALFDNWDMYTSALETSRNSLGTLQRQQDTYMESTAAHLQQLKTEWEDFYDSLIDADDINNVLDAVTKLIFVMSDFLDGIGGGRNGLLMLGSTATMVFDRQISAGITNAIQSFGRMRTNAVELQAQLDNIQLFKQTEQYQTYEPVKALVDSLDEVSKYYDILNNDQINQANAIAQQVADAKELELQWKSTTDALEKFQENLDKTRYGGIASKSFDLNNLSHREERGVALNDYSKTIKEFSTEGEELVSNFKEISKTGVINKEFLDSIESVKDRFVDINKVGLFDNIDQKKVDILTASLKSMQKYAKTNNIPKLEKSLNRFREVTEQTTPEVKKMAEELIQANQVLSHTNIDAATQSLKQFLDTAKLQNTVKGFVDGFAALGQFTSGLTSLTNAFDILGNEALSTKEKVAQFLSGFSMGMSMLLSSAMKLPTLIDSFRALPGIFSNIGTGIAQWAASSNSLAIAQRFINEATGEQKAELLKLYKVQKLEDITLDEDTAKTIANTAAKSGNVTATEVLNGAVKKLWATLSANPLFWVAGSIALLAGVVKIVDGYYDKIAKKAAEASKAQADASQKAVDAAKAQLEAVQQLTQEYDNLKSSYSEANVEELRKKVYDLCQQYGVQIDMLRLMKANYQELQQIIDELNTNALIDLNEKTLDNINKQTQYLADNAKQIETETVGTATHLYLVLSKIASLNFPFLDQLTNFNKAASNWNKMFDKSNAQNIEGIVTTDFEGKVQINWDEYYAASAETQKEVKDYLEKTYDGFLGSIWSIFDKSGQAALKAVRENQENQDKIREQQEEYNKSKAQEIYDTEFENIDITTAGDYNNTITKLAERIKTDIEVTEEEAIKLAEEKLAKSDNAFTVKSAIAVGTELAPSYGKSAEDVADDYNKLSTVEKNFVSENLNLASAYDNLDKFIKDYHDVIKKENTDQQILDVGIALTNADGEEIKPEDIERMFSNEGFSQTLGKSKETFESESYDQQIADLSVYYIKANQLENDFQKTKRDNIQKDKEARQAEIDEQINQLNSIKDAITTQFEGVEESDLFVGIANNLEQQLQDAFNDFSTEFEDLGFLGIDSLDDFDIAAALEAAIDPAKELTQAQEYYIEILKEKNGYDDEDIKLLYNKIQANKEYQNALQDSNLPKEIKDTKSYSKALEKLTKKNLELASVINKLNKVDVPWDEFKKQVEDMKKSTDAAIDSLQGAYSSLTSIMEEYNDTQTLSMDNLQTLLNMDTQYLSALQIENGQMTLNEEALKQIALAKLDEAEAEAYAQAMEELHNETTRQAIQDSANAKVALADYGAAATSAAEAARAGAADWKAYWDAALNREGVANDETAQKIGQALQNKLQAIDQVRQQIQSGNFGSTMNGVEKSSSSSASAKEPDQEEHLEREVDLYREVNQQLKQIESTLSRIQKQNSYKWGKDLQEGLKRENKLLDKQLAKLKEKSRIQQKDLAQRRADLESQGISFSKDGSSMKNAESQLDKLYAEYNSMVDQYNSMSAEQQEEYKKQLEAKKKDIDKFENDLKNYESLFNEYQSVLDELQELHYAQIENAVERFNNMVDVHLELDDAKKEWTDFWYEVVQDVDESDFGGKIAQSMAKLQTLVGLNGKANKSEIAELTNHLNDTIDEVTKQIASRKRGGEDSLFEDATKLSKENLEKYRDKLMDAVREAKEEVDNIAENYTKILESAKDLIDEQVDGLEAISDHLEHNIELFKIMEGVNAYGPVIREYEKLYQNDLKLLNTQRQSKEFWAGEIDRYEKLLATTEKGTVQWKTYSENLKTASENYKKSVQDLDKVLEETLKHLEELRKNQTEVIFNELDKTLSNGRGLDMVEEEWKLINDLSSRYLDNVERALETELYTNDLEKAANAIGLSAENQAKLNSFMDDELTKLKAKNKLTQYDIDESRARLAILQAEIALEEQRNNKSKMRLRRDSQGNYNYQYVGDEQAIEDAENGVLTAKKEWYELVKKRYKEVNDYNIELRKQYTEYNKLANEAEQQQDYEKAKFLRGLANEVYKELEQNNEEINKNTQDLISGTSQFFADVANASVLPTSSTVAAALINDTEEIGQAGQKAVKDLEQVQNEYVEKTKEAIREAGVEYENLVENGIDPTTESLEDLVDTQEDLADKLEDVNDELDTQEENLKKCEDAYRDLKDAAVSAIEAANNALEKLSQTAIDTQQKVAASVAAAQAAASAAANASNSGGTSGGSQGANGATTSSVVGQYKVVRTGFGTKAVVRVTDPSNYIEAVPMKYSDLGPDKKKELYEKYGISSYKTGGFTGNWMGEGKLAVLHQKELVLNESDTSNILNAVKSIREIVGNGINNTRFDGIADAIVKMSAMQANMLSEISRSTLSALATTINNNNAEMQNYKNMTVNADFSGVHSADAIYQALRELENYGMQQSYSVAPHSNTSY